MQIVKNTDVGEVDLNSDETMWVYNGLDCCLTHEIWGELADMVAEEAQITYDFEMNMLGPALAMTRRGLRVDSEKIETMRDAITKRKNMFQRRLDMVAEAIWDKELNPNSPVQLQNFFYGALAIPKVTKFVKGKQKVSTDKAALETIEGRYFRARIFCMLINALRDCSKKLGVLNSTLSDDGRLRCSFNVAGTETGRWSSSQDVFREGTNLQNMTDELRVIVVPDEGQKLFYADLEQAESRVVAYLSGDQNYIDSCEAGDLHTYVAKMIWPQFAWTGVLKEDRKLAESPYFGQFSYRDICKRAGHGTNYGLMATSLGRHLKIPVRTATKFQLDYYGGSVKEKSLYRWHQLDPLVGFDKMIENGVREGEGDKAIIHVEGAFPGIRRWHREVQFELQTTGILTSPMGRRRVFWGRPNDDSTLREAIAYVPQSTVGDLLNVGLFRIWNELEPDVQVLGQVHDAVLGQFPIDGEGWEDKIIECMVNPVTVNGHLMSIPSSIEMGMNWAHFNDDPTRGPLNLEGIH